MAALFAKHRAAPRTVERTRAAERDRAQREDLLRFQVSELDAARLRPGEEEALRAERQRLQHAERFASGLAEVAAPARRRGAVGDRRVSRAPAASSRDLARLDPALRRRRRRPGRGAPRSSRTRCIALRALRDRVQRASRDGWRRSTTASTRSPASSASTATPTRRCSRFRDEAAAELDRLAAPRGAARRAGARARRASGPS